MAMPMLFQLSIGVNDIHKYLMKNHDIKYLC